MNQFERCHLKKNMLSLFYQHLLVKTVNTPPLVILFGVSGSGKSLLGNLFTKLYNTATILPDASDIEKFSLFVHKKSIKVNDAEILINTYTQNMILDAENGVWEC